MADKRRTSPTRNCGSNVFEAVEVPSYPERELEFIQVKSVTYSPLTDSCYNKSYILCIS